MKEQYEKLMFSEDFHKASYEKRLIFESLETVISFLCFYSVYASFIFIGTLDEAKIYSGLPMLLTLLLMSYLKNKIKVLSKFIVVSCIAVLINIAALYSNITVTYNVLFLLVYLIYYIRKVMKNRNVFLTVAQLAGMNLFMGFIYGFSLIYSASRLQGFLFVLSIIHIVVSLIYFYLSSSEKVLYWEECSDSRYRKNLRNTNLIFSLTLVLLLALILMASYKVGVFKELDYLYGYLLNSFIKVPLPNWQPSNVQTTPNLINSSRLIHFAKDNPLSDGNFSFLWYVFIIILIVGCIILLILAPVGIIMFSLIVIQAIYKMLISKHELGEQREFLTSKEIVQDTISKVRVSLKAVKNSVHKSNRDKVRDVYSKLVRAYISRGLEIEQSNTPVEIQESISHKYSTSMTKATEIYEKARYGKEDLMNEEVKEINKHLK